MELHTAVKTRQKDQGVSTFFDKNVEIYVENYMSKTTFKSQAFFGDISIYRHQNCLKMSFYFYTLLMCVYNILFYLSYVKFNGISRRYLFNAHMYTVQCICLLNYRPQRLACFFCCTKRRRINSNHIKLQQKIKNILNEFSFKSLLSFYKTSL